MFKANLEKNKVEFRKVVSSPLIKRGLIEACEDTGMTYTEFVYSLLVQEITRRNCDKNISNGKLSTKSFLVEVSRVVEKYERSMAK